MGHRCNYVYRHDGTRELFYSHWGALTVPRDFFWGLDAARDFLAQHDGCEEDGWLDDVFGEGGAALDLDERTLTIYGGEIYGAARDLLVDLMRAVWARDDFTVRDADSFIDIATAVGLPARMVEAEHLPWPAIDVTKDDDVGRDKGHFDTLVVVDGVLRFCAYHSAKRVLELGASRVGELDRLPDLAEAKHLWATKAPPEWETERYTLARRISDAIVIDTRAKRITAARYEIRRSTSRNYYLERWPGYELAGFRDVDEVLASLAHPELAPTPSEPPPSIEDQLGEIEKFLFGTRSDPTTLMASIIKEHPGGIVNPHALVSPVDGRPNDAPSANATFRRVVAHVLAKRAYRS
jgi:hypothetical protein